MNDRPWGTWANKARDRLREQNQALQNAHVQINLAFTPSKQRTARERVLARTRAVIQMRDACEGWLVALERTVDAAERSREEGGA